MKHLRIMKLPLFFALGLFYVSNVWGQDADALLNKLSNQAKSYGSIEATYTSKMVDRVSDFESTQSGKIYVDGSKYHLDIGEYIIVSDGITIWTYEPGVNDCYIDDAEVMAEEGLDPAKLFTIWEDDFKTEWKGPSKVKGQSLIQINLYPLSADEKPFHTIQLFIDESALELKRAIVKGRDGTDMTYDVETFNPRAKVAASKFTFKPSDYPGVNLVDNRI